MLKELGKRKFKTADGNILEFPVSEAYITINGEGITSLVAVADEGTPILLGVTTLELLGLQVDPHKRKTCTNRTNDSLEFKLEISDF